MCDCVTECHVLEGEQGGPPARGGGSFSVGGEDGGKEKSHREGAHKGGRNPAKEQGHRDTEKARHCDANKGQRQR